MLITRQEAMKMYLSKGYDSIMPFDSTYEQSFIKTLESLGVRIVNTIDNDDSEQYRNYLDALNEYMEINNLDNLEMPHIIPYEIQEMNPFKEK